MTRLVSHFTINSGDQVSETVRLDNVTDVTLWVPTVDSCQLFLQGAWDTTSANFVRLMTDQGSQDFVLQTGPGSLAAILTTIVAPLPALRVETSVAQTDNRTLTLISKV